MDDNNTVAQVAVQANLMRMKYGTLVIICGLVAVLVVFLGVMIVFIASQAILKPAASDVTTVTSTAVSEIGIIVGLFFGVQVGVTGK